MSSRNMSIERECYDEIHRRLKQAGEWRFGRGRPAHPPFQGAERAAHRLLTLLPARTFLVMRDAALRPVREAVLDSGRILVVPDTEGHAVWRFLPQAMLDPQGNRTPLTLKPLPRCAQPYTGQVDVVVVGCLGFSADPYLYSFDNERVAGVLDNLRDGTDTGFHLGSEIPVIAVAADCQEVSGWPDVARSYVRADAVVTPTRVVNLGSRTI